MCDDNIFELVRTRNYNKFNHWAVYSFRLLKHYSKWSWFSFMINFYHIYENCFVCTSNKMSDGSKRQKKKLLMECLFTKEIYCRWPLFVLKMQYKKKPIYWSPCIHLQVHKTDRNMRCIKSNGRSRDWFLLHSFVLALLSSIRCWNSRGAKSESMGSIIECVDYKILYF